MKAVLRYKDNGYDTKIIFGLLAEKNIKIINASEHEKVIIDIDSYDDLNKLVAELNSNSLYGVIIEKVKEHKLLIERFVSWMLGE